MYENYDDNDILYYCRIYKICYEAFITFLRDTIL